MGTDCATCDTALVYNSGTPPHDVDIVKTSAALEERVVEGRMRIVRADVPLGDMLALAESDRKFTIVSFLTCESCGRTRFWGLSIRGAPTYRVVEAGAPATWPWEAVPPRHLWA